MTGEEFPKVQKIDQKFPKKDDNINTFQLSFLMFEYFDQFKDVLEIHKIGEDKEKVSSMLVKVVHSDFQISVFSLCFCRTQNEKKMTDFRINCNNFVSKLDSLNFEKRITLLKDLKEEGNERFREGSFSEALDRYLLVREIKKKLDYLRNLIDIMVTYI